MSAKSLGPSKKKAFAAPGAPGPVVEAAVSCETCAADLAFLKEANRPDYAALPDPVRVVDLFAGGGGLSLGVAEAARRVGRGIKIVLAVEQDGGAADAYGANFPSAEVERTDIADVFDGALGAALSKHERAIKKSVGRVDVLVGGPPCQGHSDLNNHTRRSDPRNALYLRAVRAVEVLKPTFVVIENVPAVQHDKGKVLDKAEKALQASGYRTAAAVLNLVDFGVPQRRRRHILIGVQGDVVEPGALLTTESPCRGHDDRTVRWAIEDLDGRKADGLDAASTPTAENLKRMRWLIKNNKYNLPNRMRPSCHRDKEHTYDAMYGRLNWDAPAPTITTGFGSMGQGRFVHPGHPRTITPHEAARLQTLPDFFKFGAKGRGAIARVIGNAVPPLLGAHLVEPMLRALPQEVAIGENGVQPAPKRSGAPTASSETIRKRMASTKQRDTKPELALRAALHRMGLRYAVDRPVNGSRQRADIVFTKQRIAVYVDGCFWHACPEHGTLPKQNRDWWKAKFAANRERDATTTAALIDEGWRVIRFWEHDDVAAAAHRVAALVRLGRQGTQSTRRR
ncbi:MAG: DNA mismatch endonuclease Vsr [Acidimicrobiales bacterium]|nr:DNA mismatch endonuclease Vsr [Acidimicrobiales bacterium]